MDAHLNPQPSQARFLELTSLKQSRKDPHFPSILKPFLNLISSSYIRDFLFTPSPMYVQQLLSPNLPQRSLLCATTNTTIDLYSPPPSAAHLSGQSQHHAGYHLFVPVSISGYVTMGIGVYRGVSSSQSPLLPSISSKRKMELNFRFIHDAYARSLLLLYEAHQDGCYIVRSRCFSTTRVDNHFTGIFPLEQLRSIALRQENITLANLLQYLYLCEDGPFVTLCSLCNKDRCNCNFREPTANVPGEFGLFISAMPSFITTKTTTAIRLIADRRPAVDISFQKAVVGVRSSVQGIIDANVREHLRSWAISDYTQGLQQHPMESQQLFSNSEDAYLVYLSHGDKIDSALECNEQYAEGQRAHTYVAVQTQHAPIVGNLELSQNQETHYRSCRLEAQRVQSSQPMHQELNEDSAICPEPRRLNPVPVQKRTKAGEKTEEQKEEERRERNRQAARRSAMREKAAFQNLQLQVSTNHETIRQLKARERFLRDENMKLRDHLLMKLDFDKDQ